MGHPERASKAMMGTRTIAPIARPAQGAVVRPYARDVREAYVAARATISSNPDTLEPAATPARRPAAAKAAPERKPPAELRSPTAAAAMAPTHAIDMIRSGVMAKRPIAISGTSATTRAAAKARGHAAPHARHASAISHGRAAASTVVTRCARSGLGAEPAPMARAKSPTRPGWSR